jgi:hypothetical protein
MKLLWCGLFCIAASLARAQQPQLFLTDQRGFNQFGPAPTTQAPAEETEYQEELGPLHPLLALRYQPFQVYSDTSYLYDDNILMTYHKPVEDYVVDQVFGATYSPRLFENLKTTIYAQHYIDHYDGMSAFDFDGNQAGVDLAYTLVPGPIPYHQEETLSAWTLYGDGSYEQLDSIADSVQIFEMVDARLGLRCDYNALLPTWMGRFRHIAPFYGYQFDWRLSNPSILTRADNTVFLGASLDLLRNVYVQFLGQVAWQDYLNANRTDLTETLSASVVWRICKYASVNANGVFANNNSSQNPFSYRVISGGPSVTLQIRF